MGGAAYPQEVVWQTGRMLIEPLGDGCAPPFQFEEEGERLKVVWPGRGPRMWECWAPVMQAIEDEMPRASRL